MEHAEIVDLAGAERWNYFIQQLPPAFQDIHFTAEYHRMYEMNGDGKAILFVRQANEKLFFYPFMLRPVDGTPWFDIETVYGYTGPVSSTNDATFLHETDEQFRAFCKERNVVSEFVRFHPLLQNQQVAVHSKGMSVIGLREYVWVDLSKTIGDLEGKYSSQNRNKIRKAEKNGVKIIEDKSGEQFDEFVRIYSENMQNLNASSLYYFSPVYFDCLRELVRSNGTLLLALHDKQFIAAAVFLRGKAMGHYFLSSATPEGKSFAAANLLLHQGIRWCREKGLKQLHLGGGMSSDERDPLLVFKKNFSRETATFYIGKRIHREDIYRKLCEAWDREFAPASAGFSHMLQRYRLTEKDVSQQIKSA